MAGLRRGRVKKEVADAQPPPPWLVELLRRDPGAQHYRYREFTARRWARQAAIENPGVVFIVEVDGRTITYRYEDGLMHSTGTGKAREPYVPYEVSERRRSR